MKILVVEDELRVAQVLERGLKEEGYDTDVAYDGEVGLAKAQSGQYDLVLLDVNLPMMNGLEPVRLELLFEQPGFSGVFEDDERFFRHE